CARYALPLGRFDYW
nr:immunoglobulin heavy chain junction region [Macaca mulatta]